MPRRQLPVPQVLQLPLGVLWAVVDATGEAARQVPGHLLRAPLVGIMGGLRLSQWMHSGGHDDSAARPAPGVPAAFSQPRPPVASDGSAAPTQPAAQPTVRPPLTAVPDAAEVTQAVEVAQAVVPDAADVAQAVEMAEVAEVAEVANPLDLPLEVLAADVATGAALTNDALPLPDYDHMTLGSLRGRLRSLDLVSLVQIRDYERAHANRLPIVSMLENRIVKITAAAPVPAPPDDGSRL